MSIVCGPAFISAEAPIVVLKAGFSYTGDPPWLPHSLFLLLQVSIPLPAEIPAPLKTQPGSYAPSGSYSDGGIPSPGLLVPSGYGLGPVIAPQPHSRPVLRDFSIHVDDTSDALLSCP